MIRVLRPEYISLRNWVGALINDFPEENIPLLDDEDKWEEWAMKLANTGVFKRANIPGPFSLSQGKREKKFEAWQDWAKVVYMLMTNEPPVIKNRGG